MNLDEGAYNINPEKSYKIKKAGWLHLPRWVLYCWCCPPDRMMKSFWLQRSTRVAFFWNFLRYWHFDKENRMKFKTNQLIAYRVLAWPGWWCTCAHDKATHGLRSLESEVSWPVVYHPIWAASWWWWYWRIVIYKFIKHNAYLGLPQAEFSAWMHSVWFCCPIQCFSPENFFFARMGFCNFLSSYRREYVKQHPMHNIPQDHVLNWWNHQGFEETRTCGKS